ncbi:MAG: symmetrical bis(5'-nucleosyl)-tetraphosphatase [Gammaproteobacteria bacterium]|nr:MAG: symmetrical bis(5'-nucleosyl)-tetraphosphatase [Gammaproteobacteria bacterium]
MAIYAIGDVQGCFDELQELVSYISFNPEKDQLWFVGDLVNRGPKSLETLRWVKSLGSAAVTVLGNHDLHLLAAYAGIKELSSTSSLNSVLKAKDIDELINWLRQQPLMSYSKKLDFAMVHGGLAPQWDIKEALSYAKEVETKLRSKNYKDFLNNMYGDQPNQWDGRLKGWNRLRTITNFMTRVRYCTNQGVMSFTDKGPPGTQSTRMKPWYEIASRKSQDTTIVFGHWSTLGHVNNYNIIATDTGCLWGGALTAVQIENDKFITYQVECEAKRQVPR